MVNAIRIAVLLSVFLAFSSNSKANILIENVPVGNAGNAGEWSGVDYGGYGPNRICGAVDYDYQMGKYEITAGQYTAFLNAVAAADTYGLYNEKMGDPYTYQVYGCNIIRSGIPGNYTYSVDAEWANRPVNYVSWGDAARFANWMHNGQPNGIQNTHTTENGSYCLNGAMSLEELNSVARNSTATWVIPSEDEWYKSAYHKNDGITGNYWEYTTSTDITPSNTLVNPDPGNNANFHVGGVYTIGGPYWRTEVGEFENSESPYGTFDQGGNVWEWNETVVDEAYRGWRGGSFLGYEINYLHSGVRNHYFDPTMEFRYTGFRLALVPEPTSLALLVFVSSVILRREKVSTNTCAFRFGD